MEWTVFVLTEALVHIVHLRCLASNSCQNDRLGDRFAVTRCGLKTIVPGARATTAFHPVPKRCCRFAAWPKPPNAAHACKTRTRPRCRSALSFGVRPPSFCRGVLCSARCEIADSEHADIRRRYQSLWSLSTALCAGNAYRATSR